MTRCAVVTGASSGVGLTIAHHLSSRMQVAVVARREDRLRAAFDGVGSVSIYRCDAADLSALSATLEEIGRQHGAIDTLINNAGIMVKQPFADLRAEDIECSFAINVLAPMRAMQAVLPAMRKNNFGRIVNVTSGAPFNCFPNFAAYSATKAALNALTITAAREYAENDIKINLMSPGPVRTEMAPDAPMDPAVCLPTADYLVDLPANGPTGRFFWLGRELPAVPDLSGVQWLEGAAPDRFPIVVPGTRS
jgi:NAD(P)-dependent dehydrogenase (short-subunit alcohol dehydrogenase family)